MTHILVLSMHDEMLYGGRALRAGALGYVMKRATTGKVIEGIRQVLQGQLFISKALAERMASSMSSASAARPSSTRCWSIPPDSRRTT